MESVTLNQAKAAVKAFRDAQGNKAEAARILGWQKHTYQHRLQRAQELHGLKLPEIDRLALAEEVRVEKLQREIKRLSKLNTDMKAALITTEKVKELIHGTSETPKPKKWTFPKAKAYNTGIGNLLLSDWHWDEYVDPKQVNGINAYNPTIQLSRAQGVFEKTGDLLVNKMAAPKYDYLVMNLGGDFITGDIHEELAETNIQCIPQTLLSLQDVMIGGIDHLLELFRYIELYCVPGNHGRIHKKKRHKNQVYESYEWLFYHMLARYYRDNERVRFHVSDSPDIQYRCFDTTYCLTHGDQFQYSGGVGGPIVGIIKGDAKKRKRQMAVRQPYDYLMGGHFHTLMRLYGIIFNGSLIGLSEYSFDGMFDYELPMQALWVTHKTWGITAEWRLILEKPGRKY